MEIKCIVSKDGHKPTRATEGAAGLDVFAYLPNGTLVGGSTVIPPRSSVVIHTGVKIEIPYGYEGQLRGRSGLAFRHGVIALHSPGTIDSDYRGEIAILLHNTRNEPFRVQHGMRVGQLVIAKVEMCELVNADELDDTERGQNGFGSTGL